MAPCFLVCVIGSDCSLFRDLPYNYRAFGPGRWLSYEISAAGIGIAAAVVVAATAAAVAAPAAVAAAAPNDDQQNDDPAAVAASEAVIAHTGTS